MTYQDKQMAFLDVWEEAEKMIRESGTKNHSFTASADVRKYTGINNETAEIVAEYSISVFDPYKHVTGPTWENVLEQLACHLYPVITIETVAPTMPVGRAA